MYNIDEEFAKYKEKVEKENKKYEKCEISADNFTFPHIFLTDEEIIEFNAECKRSKIDLQVIPLSEYMNISLIDKEDRDINDDMKFIDNCYIPKKEDYEEEKKEEDKTINKKNANNEKMNLDNIIKNVNEYIGKKQKRIINDDYDESDVSDEKSQKTIFSFKSSIEFSKNKLKKEKEKEKDNEKEKEKEKEKENKDMKNTNKNKNKSRDRLKKAEKDDNKNNKKKKIVQKKDENNNNNNKNIIDRYFKKLIDTSEYEQNMEKRKGELIKEILEKSQNLTKEGLLDIAKTKHINCVGDEFKINDLQQRTVNQLASLLEDIKFNSNINKLDPKRKANIKTIRNKEEREKEKERKSLERIIKKKKMREEEKKKNESINKSIDNKNNNEKEKKMDDDEISSGSSYDDDSLN